jgi:hypothetical protein
MPVMRKATAGSLARPARYPDNALRGTMESRFAAERRPAMRGPCAMERRFAYNEPAYYGPVYRGPGYYPPHTSQHGTVQ